MIVFKKTIAPTKMYRLWFAESFHTFRTLICLLHRVERRYPSELFFLNKRTSSIISVSKKLNGFANICLLIIEVDRIKIYAQQFEVYSHENRLLVYETNEISK